MNELFGIPIDTLLIVLAVLLAMVACTLGVLALRHRVLLKLGVRNVGRRRARSGRRVLSRPPSRRPVTPVGRPAARPA